MEAPTALILGLGNDLVSDDGFGPAVARACRELLGGREDVTVEEASRAGLDILPLLSAHRRALIVDVVRTERRPAGTVLEWPLAQAGEARCLGGSHQVDLPSALVLGRLLGWPLPESVKLLVAEAEDLATLHEGLTPAVAEAVKEAAAIAVRWVEDGTLEEVAP